MVTAKRAALTQERIQAIARALADPRRYEILRRLGKEEQRVSCGALCACVGISPATMSHHMKELEAAGLVTSEREGRFVIYRFRRDVLGAYLDHMAEI